MKFKPKQSRQNPKTKRWECLAFPYADKRVYEDRLNELAFGAWSTPYTPPIVAGNKLVVPVTVVLYGVAHTDFGEAFLSSTTRKGDTREEENSAAEAYSQAFRRACSQFGLGRYLYQLPKLWLPNEAAAIPMMPEGERIAWVEKLYTEAGLLPLPTHRLQQNRSASSPQENQPSSRVNATASGSVPQAGQVPTASLAQGHQKNNPESSTKPQTTQVPTLSSTPLTPQPSQQPPAPPQQRQRAAAHKEKYVDAPLLKYLRNTLDAEQTRKACRYYHVTDLADLTPDQALHLSDYIEHQQKKTAAAGSLA